MYSCVHVFIYSPACSGLVTHFYMLLLVVAACTSAQVHVQAEEDARKELAGGARMAAAESELHVASSAGNLGNLLPPPPRRLEADLRKLYHGFVFSQPAFCDLSSGDLENPELTWADTIESQVFLREQPHLSRALINSAGNYAGNPELAALAQDVAGADTRLTEALSIFANAHASASAPDVRATVPGLFRLDPGLLASNPLPPMGFRPELAHKSFCGIAPVCSGDFFDNTCRHSLVLVRDASGRTFAVNAPRQDVAQFNSDCRETYRRHGPDDERIGLPCVVSDAGSRTAAALSGSTALEAAVQPTRLDDDVFPADDAFQHDTTPDRRQRGQQPATQGPSPPRLAVESAPESDRPRRQPPRLASVVATPTRPEPGPRAPLVSPTSAVVAGKFQRKRFFLKKAQFTLMAADMMKELEVYRIKGFGRAGKYGHFGYDDPQEGKTLSADGLAVRLGRDVPLRPHARV